MPVVQRHKNKRAAGFTIIELLIAVTVFSLVLILITTGVLRFTRQYYKGVISGQTQDTARAIVDDITRSIQFNGGDVATILANPGLPQNPSTNPAIGYCFGQEKLYRFYLNSQVTDQSQSPIASQHQALHAMVSETVSGCNANTSAPSVKNTAVLAGTNARELLGAHMRLAKFTVSGSGNLWTVDIKVVYGDDQLLCSTSVSVGSQASCRNASPPVALPALNPTDLGNLACRASSGNSEFCATSELQTTIDKRVKRVN